MELQILPQHFTVCQVKDLSTVDLTAPFVFLAKTDEELSLVCPTEYVPADTIAREDGWRGFRVAGVLDFSLLGILAKLATLLAEAGISIFAVSSYNTDYILTNAEQFDKALAVLKKAGYMVI